jgi:hypothetical protein
MTLCFGNMSSAFGLYVVQAQPLIQCQLKHRTCPITADHTFLRHHLPRHHLQLPMSLSRQVFNIWRTGQYLLGFLRGHHLKIIPSNPCVIQIRQLLLACFLILVGRYIALTVGTLSIPFEIMAFPLASFLQLTHSPMAGHYFGNSLCPTILSGASALLDHVCSSGLKSKLTGYIVHSHRYQGSKPTQKFWDIQAHNVKSLSIFMAFVHPDHDGCTVSCGFFTKLCNNSWLISDAQIVYTAYRDPVAGSCHLIVGVHSNAEQNCTSLKFKTLPTPMPQHLGCHLWAPFNQPKMVVLDSMHDPCFSNHAVNDSGLPPLLASI